MEPIGHLGILPAYISFSNNGQCSGIIEINKLNDTWQQCRHKTSGNGIQFLIFGLRSGLFVYSKVYQIYIF